MPGRGIALQRGAQTQRVAPEAFRKRERLRGSADFIANGADINAKADFNSTVLHLASEVGNKDMVEVLVSKGAEVNAKDDVGETPLACAARCGHIEIAQMLQKAGAKE